MDLKCPNCGTPGIPGADGTVVCPVCGGRFKFEAGEARLAGVAEFDNLKRQVADQADQITKLRERLAATSDNGHDPNAEIPDDADDPADDDEEEDDDEDEEF